MLSDLKYRIDGLSPFDKEANSRKLRDSFQIRYLIRLADVERRDIEFMLSV